MLFTFPPSMMSFQDEAQIPQDSIQGHSNINLSVVISGQSSPCSLTRLPPPSLSYSLPLFLITLFNGTLIFLSVYLCVFTIGFCFVVMYMQIMYKRLISKIYKELIPLNNRINRFKNGQILGYLGASVG